MTCKDCVYYITDEDENGNVTEYHHSEKDEGFCAIRDLFFIRKADDEICEDFIKNE